MTEQQAAETSRRWARFHFRRMPHVRGSLDYLGTNEMERTERIDTFIQVVTRLNDLLDDPDHTPPEFADVNQLRNNINGKKIPTLATITESPAMADAVHRTFEFGKKDFPSWADSAMRSPAMPAVGVFLEGFGYFLGSHIHGEHTDRVLATKRSFVKGFEEILLVEYPGSSLLSDVIDWMKEEKSDFPLEIQPMLT